MSGVHWRRPISGSFTNPADWSHDTVPGRSDDAVIEAVGDEPYTITSSANVVVKSIQIGADAVLSITAGKFKARDGTGAGANAGVILVGAHARLAVAGQIANAGLIEIEGGALVLTGYETTLSGGGQVELANVATNRIDAAKGAPFAFLNNVDNTISGSGSIGKSGRLFVYNDSAGVINADSADGLVIYHGIHNDGLVEATGAGGLTIQGNISGFDDSTGIFLAKKDSTIRFAGTKVSGTLTTQGNGSIVSDDSYIRAVTNEGILTISNYSTLVDGIDNKREIFITGYAYSNDATLSGRGTVTIGYGDDLFAYSENSTLTNVDNTIVGEGLIGVSLINGSKGVIDGNGAHRLGISTAYSPISNAGTLESTGLGGLGVFGWDSFGNRGLILASDGTLSLGNGDYRYSISNTGTIEATGAGVVRVGAPIANAGTISVQLGGTLTALDAVTGGGVAVIDGGTLDFLSEFDEAVTFSGAGTLALAQSQSFTSALTGFSPDGATTLDLADISFVGAGEATFSGTASSGVLTVTDGAHTARITLEGNYLSAAFVASSDGQGGTDVVARSAREPLGRVLALVSAMADFGAPASGQIQLSEAWGARAPPLAAPRTAMV